MKRKKRNKVTKNSIMLRCFIILLVFFFAFFTLFYLFYRYNMRGRYSDLTNNEENIQSDNTPQHVTFLINEGKTQQDIADMLENENIISADEFMNACNNNQYNYSFLQNIPHRNSRLEGYLFPDTYFFSLNPDADEIINKLLTKFDDVYTDDMIKRANELEMTVDDIITVASIIEKEVKIAEERPVVASVIYNRLKNNMRLQMDSTVLYAMGEHKDRVTNEHLQTESPYNTYNVDGLPEGPICNPGFDSINAALYPEDTDYLYYVVQDDATGKHYFTNDYNDFLNAKQKYISKFN